MSKKRIAESIAKARAPRDATVKVNVRASRARDAELLERIRRLEVRVRALEKLVG